MPPITVTLTDKQRAHLWQLVRDEAISLGYGTTYSHHNKRQWPRRLRELSTIASKLHSTMRNS